MNTALLSSPGSGLLSGWAVRSGLGLASWGLQRATRRTDRDRLLRRLEARAAAEAALAERDAIIRSAGYLPL
ncbi:hypothetical protein [Agromyces sp. Soil535]|uniref:hypothetical protein n=1 Tax=Agromyces sp. Soil535 TaxID=1736390 RepID=UPI000701D3B0|nr:hypothetical protein [Agromyces sp. Soil535]KRE26252.1 hypothetical protein ASG80_05570 [Agromyces sp. Soil535]